MDGAPHFPGRGRTPGDVLFIEDFDPPAHPGGAAPGAIAPATAEPGLAAARRAGHEEGFAAGRQAGIAEGKAQARADHEEAVRAALGRIAAALREARDAAREIAEAAAEETARLLLAVLRAALPALCARHGEAEVRHLARSLLPSLAAEPRVVVRANPHHLPALREEIACLDPEAAARIHLRGTDAMAEGNLAIEWQDGTASRDAGAIRDALEAALSPLGLMTCTERKELADAG